ncbi:response regulator transcription factor [Leeuwenhoekiella sp. A16]|uniref:response regulator transcription factor n=1 Tax=Leeuwenhoekiella sp. A16 TaxID=3141462 RepID=UPI003A812208
MPTKSTLSKPFQQDLTTCDHQNENTIEFFGIRKNMTTMFFQNGKAKEWSQLPKNLFVIMANAYQQDQGAKTYFSTWNIPYKRQVELFTYFGWGTLDHKPDIINGVLQPCENFRHSENCPSVKFDTKHFTINRQQLTERDLKIIDISAKGTLNTEAARMLNITVSTYNSHKAKLFKKTGTDGVVSLLMAAFKEKLIAS